MAKKSTETVATETAKPAEYRVLARKYRPKDFSELKGQDALVRTLTNAIQSGRIAHAFMLTGVRGVGKTTTARIIARALNCEKGPTITPCGVCDQCKAISEDRHVDVIEMDAASNNGIDEIRAITDNVQYAPVSGRYKIFILDEVHMLSKAAFNALLKTLEEPPEHTKFVFATTEIRRVPVTVLSRCQRFDLKRIGTAVLEQYFHEILKKENVKAEQGAVALIARAADGSARDGLSLLDQAISREPGNVTEEQVRNMLGLADRSVTLDLYEHLMKGDSAQTLTVLDSLHNAGAEPLMVIQDLLDLTHYLTKVKVSADVAKNIAVPEAERVRGAALVATLSMPVLTRTWQILSKGVTEVQHAMNPQNALEMVLIRLLYAADQPTPGDVLKQLKDGSVVSAGGAPMGNGGGAPRGTPLMRYAPDLGAVAAVAKAEPFVDAQTGLKTAINSFQELVELFGQKKEPLLQAHLVNDIHLVKFEQGHLSIRLRDSAPQNMTGRISERLSQWTGQRWVISFSKEQGEPTLGDTRRQAQQQVMDEVKAHPAVADILAVFPGTKIIDIRNKE